MIEKGKKVLLHSCCGPCAAWPVEALREEGYEPAGYFYNPNIHPDKEFKRRKETFLNYAALKDFTVYMDDDFRQAQWEAYLPEDQSRCVMCYTLRLRKTAEFAKENGFDAFTSTLFVSPYQNHELMKEICIGLQEEFNISFLYRDFRTGYRKGQSMAKEMGLYRQKYCGCIHSYNTSAFKEKIRWD